MTRKMIARSSIISSMMAMMTMMSSVMADDCVNLNLPILTAWNYPASQIPADISTNCCASTLLAGVVTCLADGTNTITGLNLAGKGLVGPFPVGLQLLQNLQTLDVSNNPSIVGGLNVVAAMPLTTFIASGDSGLNGTVPTFRSTMTDCRFDGTGLCGSPGNCQTRVAALPTCTNTNNQGGGNNPIALPKGASLAFYIVVGVAAIFIIVVVCMCIFCNQRGSVAKSMAEDGSATVGRNVRKTRPEIQGNENEMSIITLSRTGPPKRSFSLPEQREALSEDKKKLDVTAREPFLAANTPAGSEEFPVRRPYDKVRSDELTLTTGDRVVLLRVFRDGWAEGVSMRNGGPAIFPLACLDGGVPIVLAERLKLARSVLNAGSPKNATVNMPGALPSNNNPTVGIAVAPPFMPAPPPPNFMPGAPAAPPGFVSPFPPGMPGPNPYLAGPPPPMGFMPGMPLPPPGMYPPPPPGFVPPSPQQQQQPMQSPTAQTGGYFPRNTST